MRNSLAHTALSSLTAHKLEIHSYLTCTVSMQLLFELNNPRAAAEMLFRYNLDHKRTLAVGTRESRLVGLSAADVEPLYGVYCGTRASRCALAAHEPPALFTG